MRSVDPDDNANGIGSGVSVSEKDLFRTLFGRLSRHPFSTYRQDFLNRLPWRLLQTARQTAPSVVDCVGFGQLEKCLKAPAEDAQTWRNAELFPYLNYVAFPQNSKRQSCVDALRVHCRLDTLNHNTNPEVRYWRLACDDSSPRIEVVRFDGQIAVRNLEVGWRSSFYGCWINIYRPHDGLFDDVEPKLYGAQSSNRSNEELSKLLSDAFSVIHAYSKSLCYNILDQISTISFLKEVVGRPISYSLRNRYIGAIFVTVTTAVEVAEQIIHEYYHQCIWPWWLVEPPEDLPDAGLQVVSPITGAIRSLPTMVQATLIYASLQDFYSFASVRCDLFEDAAAVHRARARHQMIGERFDDLAKEIGDQLLNTPATRAVVDVILELRKDVLCP